VDAQCDKLAMVVGRTKVTTLETADGAAANSKSRVWDKVLEASVPIFEATEIPLRHSEG